MLFRSVTEGSVCSLSFSFYATHASTTNTFSIKWYDETGALQSTSTVAMPASGSVPTSWTEYTEEITVDAAGTQGEIVLVGISSGGSNLSSKAYFDGISIINQTNLVTLAGTQTIDGVKTFSGANTFSGVNSYPATQKWAKGADIASATALVIGTDGNYFDVTGTVTITSITTVGVGVVVKLHFDGALILTHHATDLVLMGGANITTAAGDEAEFIEYATGDWRCLNYVRAAASPNDIIILATPELLQTLTTSNTVTNYSSSTLGTAVATHAILNVQAEVTTASASGSLNYYIADATFIADDKYKKIELNVGTANHAKDISSIEFTVGLDANQDYWYIVTLGNPTLTEVKVYLTGYYV